MNEVTLNTGYTMPTIAFGTWDVRGAAGRAAVESALEVGYRALDTAFMYDNHAEVGAAIAASGVPRDQLFVTTKLNAPLKSFALAADGIARACEELQLDYIDLVLVHEPYRASVQMYKACEAAQSKGIARSIGVSNFDEAHLRVILDECDVVPAVDQCESHVYYPQLGLARHLQKRGICMQAWAPFTEGRRAIFDDPALVDIARAHDATPAQIALAFLLGQGIAVCVKSASRARQEQNLLAADIALSESEVARIAALDEGRSLFGWYDEGWLAQ